VAKGIDRKAARADGQVQYLSREEGRALFDRQARELMNMSGEEFLRRYDAGEFDDILDDSDHPHLMHLAMLIPFGR
jgi:hypothetical protein